MNLNNLEQMARMSQRGEAILEKCNLMLEKGLLTRAEYLSLTTKTLQPAGPAPASPTTLAFDGIWPDSRWI